MISRIGFSLVILSTFLANAEDTAFTLRARSSPFFSVEVTLNDQPVQSMPAGAKVEVAESVLLTSQVEAFNQMRICFKGSQISNSKPNIHNLGVLEMLPFKTSKPILRFVSTPANQFVPGSMNCGIFYFTPTSVITQSEYQQALGSREVVVPEKNGASESDAAMKVVKGVGGTSVQNENRQAPSDLAMPSEDLNRDGTIEEKLQQVADQLRSLSSMSKEGQSQAVPEQNQNGNLGAPSGSNSGTPIFPAQPQ